MKILDNAKRDGVDAPVIPMALTNLWGSFFSRVEQGTAMVKPFRRGLFSQVGLNVGNPMAGETVEPSGLRVKVKVLLEQNKR